MKIGSLFSGIGGLELGLEMAGVGHVVWQAEMDLDARRVLRAHWPRARLYSDVREVRSDVEAVDLVCGGFPCQDLSTANVTGRQRLDGARSGLWREYARIVGLVAPRWVVVENVGGAWRDWVPYVRADLARLGYASVPLALSTADVGAPYHRDRIFVLAHSDGEEQPLRAVHAALASLRADAGRLGEGVRRACDAALACDDELPARLARLPGNAVSVAVSQVIGRAIMAAS